MTTKTVPLDAVTNALQGRDPSETWIHVTLRSGTVFQGRIFHLDTQGGLVILQESSNSIHMLQLARIQSVVCKLPGQASVPNPLPSLVQITHVPLDKLQERERLALKAEKERNAKIGVGVSKEAQVFFKRFDHVGYF